MGWHWWQSSQPSRHHHRDRRRRLTRWGCGGLVGRFIAQVLHWNVKFVREVISLYFHSTQLDWYLCRSDWCPAIPSQFPPSLLSESEQEEIQLVSALVIVTCNWEQSVFTALTLRPGLEIDCNWLSHSSHFPHSDPHPPQDQAGSSQAEPDTVRSRVWGRPCKNISVRVVMAGGNNSKPLCCIIVITTITLNFDWIIIVLSND